MKLKIDLKALGKALWNAVKPMMLGIVGGSAVVAGMLVFPENSERPENPEYPEYPGPGVSGALPSRGAWVYRQGT